VVDAGADAAVDAGCDAACLATCGFVAADWMGGCVAPEGADAGPIEDGDTDVSGTIESISRVAPSNGCLRPLGYYAGAAEPVVLVVVAGDGSRWQVEYAVPTGYQPFQVGDTIEAKYSYWKGDWSPTVARLLLTRGGRTPVWTLLGGGLGDAANSPLPLTQGAAECETTEECGTWQRHRLGVQGHEVALGGKVTTGGFTVFNGGLERTVFTSSSCYDWYVAGIAAAMTDDGSPP
jgi:hypothetical protein